MLEAELEKEREPLEVLTFLVALYQGDFAPTPESAEYTRILSRGWNMKEELDDVKDTIERLRRELDSCEEKILEYQSLQDPK